MKKYSIPFALLTILCFAGGFIHNSPAPANDSAIVPADVAWMLTASGLVMLMTPGLSFFYGGMVSARNVISTMLQSFIALSIISIAWVIIGFSLSFGDSIGGIIGNPFTYLMFKNVGAATHPLLSPTIPLALFSMFQLKFAVITPALITGSFAERVRFSAYLCFMCLFLVFIYAPLAHMTWHPQGLLRNLGVLDFAGGTVVHMSAGFAALAGAIHLGRRRIVPEKHIASNIPFVMLGTGMLWFGWFGFNCGSALAANSLASSAFIATNTASASAAITWILLDAVQGKKISALGTCIGAVVGLVAITPAAGFVDAGSSLLIGWISAVISNIAVTIKSKTGLDDTLDVFPCHGLGGLSGMILTSVFARDVGLIYGQTHTFFVHILATVGISAFAFGGSYLLYMIVNRFIPFRVPDSAEKEGLDISQHGESILAHE
jgi:Amt family ammonium transporter